MPLFVCRIVCVAFCLAVLLMLPGLGSANPSTDVELSVEARAEAWLAEARGLRERAGYAALRPELEAFLADHAGVLPHHLVTLMGAELGNMMFHQGDREAALAQHDAVLAAAQSDATRAPVLAFRSVVHFANADYEQAMADSLTALRHYDAVGDRAQQLALNVGIGIITLRLEDLDATELYFERARALESDVADESIRLRLQAHLGILFQAQQRFDEAMAAYEQAYQLATALNEPLARAQALLNIATIYNNQRQDYETALDYYQRSLVIAEAHDLHLGVVLNHTNIGIALSWLGRHDEAMASFTQARGLIDQHAGPLELRHWYRELSRAQARMGDYESALDSLNASHEVEREIFDERRDRDIAELRTAYERDLQEAELARLLVQRNLFLVIGISVSLLLLVGVAFYRWRLQRVQALYERNRELVRAQGKEAAALAAVERSHEAERNNTDPQQALYANLEKIMREQRAYTDQNLTVASLANQLGTNQKYLSAAISHHGDGHFNQFINRHRVNEARRLLSDKTNNQTVTEIMQECGFHSRSAFYAAFKRHTGLTPSQYRKAVQKDRR